METLIIVLIIIIIFIALLGRYDSGSPESRGIQGEAAVAAAVASSTRKGIYGQVFQNIYVPRNDGSTSEIDVVLVCTKGVFVFESKNYAGYIFGNEKNRKWTVSLYAGKSIMGIKTTKKHNFYNPIWQNKTHIKALQNMVKSTAPFFSIIVFSDRGELKNVTWDASRATILQTGRLKYYLRNVRETFPDVLDQDEVDRLAAIISQFTGKDESVRNAHLESIRKKSVDPEICPWCGGKLVIRTAKKGPNTGNQFYGCSNYPKCRYTRNMDKKS